MENVMTFKSRESSRRVLRLDCLLWKHVLGCVQDLWHFHPLSCRRAGCSLRATRSRSV